MTHVILSSARNIGPSCCQFFGAERGLKMGALVFGSMEQNILSLAIETFTRELY